MLGHPDHAHFPTPPCHLPPSSCKRKSPSQLRRKERCQQEGIHRAEKGAPDKEDASIQSEKEISATESLSKDTLEAPAMDHSKKPADETVEKLESFKCDICAHKASCKIIIRKYFMIEHKKPVTH